VVSYGSDLAIKLSNDFCMIIDAAWFQRLFPLMGTEGVKNTENEVATTLNGYRLAASIDGSVIGRGCDVLIVDDPLKPSEAMNESRREQINYCFNNSLLTRLDNMASGEQNDPLADPIGIRMLEALSTSAFSIMGSGLRQSRSSGRDCDVGSSFRPNSSVIRRWLVRLKA
jgi:hypothetical protein